MRNRDRTWIISLCSQVAIVMPFIVVLSLPLDIQLIDTLALHGIHTKQIEGIQWLSLFLVVIAFITSCALFRRRILERVSVMQKAIILNDQSLITPLAWTLGLFVALEVIFTAIDSTPRALVAALVTLIAGSIGMFRTLRERAAQKLSRTEISEFIDKRNAQHLLIISFLPVLLYRLAHLSLVAWGRELECMSITLPIFALLILWSWPSVTERDLKRLSHQVR
jgi:hypothetical protein